MSVRVSFTEPAAALHFLRLELRDGHSCSAVVEVRVRGEMSGVVRGALVRDVSRVGQALQWLLEASGYYLEVVGDGVGALGEEVGSDV